MLTSKDNLSIIQNAISSILPWFKQNRRMFPWRQSPTPYHVWVSEIMLQQTRINAVLPYYHRFLKAFPTVKDLANADETYLLKLWEGLGYYSRARNLQKTAKIICSQYGGNFPSDYKQLLSLPGIGPYTAAAISSICFQQKQVCVDGNVERVILRLLNNPLDIRQPKAKQCIEQLLFPAIACHHAGAFNEAIMELGEVICLPGGAPLCHICPAAGVCRGYAAGTAATLPVKSPKNPRKREDWAVVIAVDQNKNIALEKRNSTGLLANMYQFYMLQSCTKAQVLQQVQHTFGNCTLIKTAHGKHIFTHKEWNMDFYLFSVQHTPNSSAFLWASFEDLEQKYPLPTALKVGKECLRSYIHELLTGN